MNEDERVNDEHPGTEEVAQRLHAYASARLTPDRVAQERIRAAVVEEARMRALESSIGTARHRHPAGPRRLTALLLAAGLTLAGAAAVAAGSGPGGPFYGAVVWFQTATLPSDADARALERVRQIEERLLDAERAAASGDANAVAAALQAYREAVAEALAEVGTDGIHLARLEAALGHHVAVLEALSGHVPAAATNGIERAIEASQKAVDKLEASKPKPHATDPAAVPTAKPGKTDTPVTGPPTDRPDHTPRGGGSPTP